MLLRIFKGNNPAVIFLVTVIFAAVWISAFIHPLPATTTEAVQGQMPLYRLLAGPLAKSSLAGTLAAIIFTILLTFLMVNFNTRTFFINERTYLPALFLILLTGFFPEFQSLNPALPAALFLMIALMRIAEGYRKAGVASNFFDAGLLISAGSLFYANLIWFGLLVFIGIAIIRTLNISEIFISLTGLITPYVLLFGIYYVAGSDLDVLLKLIGNNLFHAAEGYHYPRITIAVLLVAGLVILVSLAYLFPMLNSKKIKARKTFSLLIWTFFISLAVYLAVPSASVEMVWITAIPASYFLTHYFVFIRKRIVPEILLSALFLAVAAVQVYYCR